MTALAEAAAVLAVSSTATCSLGIAGFSHARDALMNWRGREKEKSPVQHVKDRQTSRQGFLTAECVNFLLDDQSIGSKSLTFNGEVLHFIQDDQPQPAIALGATEVSLNDATVVVTPKQVVPSVTLEFMTNEEAKDWAETLQAASSSRSANHFRIHELIDHIIRIEKHVKDLSQCLNARSKKVAGLERKVRKQEKELQEWEEEFPDRIKKDNRQCSQESVDKPSVAVTELMQKIEEMPNIAAALEQKLSELEERPCPLAAEDASQLRMSNEQLVSALDDSSNKLLEFKAKVADFENRLSALELPVSPATEDMATTIYHIEEASSVVTSLSQRLEAVSPRKNAVSQLQGDIACEPEEAEAPEKLQQALERQKKDMESEFVNKLRDHETLVASKLAAAQAEKEAAIGDLRTNQLLVQSLEEKLASVQRDMELVVEEAVSKAKDAMRPSQDPLLMRYKQESEAAKDAADQAQRVADTREQKILDLQGMLDQVNNKLAAASRVSAACPTMDEINAFRDEAEAKIKQLEKTHKDTCSRMAKEFEAQVAEVRKEQQEEKRRAEQEATEVRTRLQAEQDKLFQKFEASQLETANFRAFEQKAELAEDRLAQAQQRSEELLQQNLRLNAERDQLMQEIERTPQDPKAKEVSPADQQLIVQLSGENYDLKAQLAATWAKITEQTKRIEHERSAFWEELESVRVKTEPFKFTPPPAPSGITAARQVSSVATTTQNKPWGQIPQQSGVLPASPLQATRDIKMPVTRGLATTSPHIPTHAATITSDSRFMKPLISR